MKQGWRQRIATRFENMTKIYVRHPRLLPFLLYISYWHRRGTFCEVIFEEKVDVAKFYPVKLLDVQVESSVDWIHRMSFTARTSIEV